MQLPRAGTETPRGNRVLLIHDNAEDARLIQTALADSGDSSYDVEWKTTLVQGLEELKSIDIVAVIVNLFLPDSHGLATFEAIMLAAPHVPILVLSTMDNEAMAKHAVQRGAHDYLLPGHLDSYCLQRALRHAVQYTAANEAQAIAHKMSHLAQHDVLTSLPNRMLLKDRLTQAIGAAHRNGTYLAVLFVDVDRFKPINDSMGHAIGDQLLQSIATRLTACVRVSDTVSRQGGDEFVILLLDIAQTEDAALSAAKILAALRVPYHIGQHTVNVNASIGISVYPRDGQHADTLIENADAAMYYAKEHGRNNYQFFRQDMRAAERQSLEENLRQALERPEFLLHYQPKFNLMTGAMTGAEALLRWQHPERGLIPPAQFVPIAENCDLMLPIGQWVLREACRQAQAWREGGLWLGQMAVNSSAVEFRSKNFIDGVRTILEETRFDPQALQIELTESVLMQDTESTTSALRALKELGVKLAVDDFGTGYSSLSYLRRFPIDAIKIDRSFVRDIGTDPDAATIVRTVISMGKSLRLRVIAEGIETPQQRAFLQRYDCDEGQGYYLGRPICAEEFAVVLDADISDAVLKRKRRVFLSSHDVDDIMTQSSAP